VRRGITAIHQGTPRSALTEFLNAVLIDPDDNTRVAARDRTRLERLAR
jgi:hypothetical protein